LFIAYLSPGRSAPYHLFIENINRNSIDVKDVSGRFQEAERVGKYMIRPLLSPERLFLDEREGKVCYRYGEKPEEVERMDYLEFIARVTSHIPDKGQVFLEGELTPLFQRSLDSLPPLLGLRPATKGAYPLGSPDGVIKPKPSL